MIATIKKLTPFHYPMLREWYEKWGQTPPRPGHFSTMGYIADGRVAGWLHLMNSDMALIEGIISDPEGVPSLRKESLLKLCGFLVDTAITLGYPTIIGITKSKSIIDVGKKLGFSELKEYKIIALDAYNE